MYLLPLNLLHVDEKVTILIHKAFYTRSDSPNVIHPLGIDLSTTTAQQGIDCVAAAIPPKLGVPKVDRRLSNR